MQEKDVLIIGGGPAGLAAALALYQQGLTNILLIEREQSLGGILRQCIHDGFGLTRFGEVLSGPEYAQRFIDDVERLQIPYVTETMVLSITPDKVVTAVSRDGLQTWRAKAIILAMGCRERPRGGLGIPGERPAGVFTAGTAQAYINMYNRMPGKDVVILGSGDIGMIMARRLTLEGARVHGVFEILPYASGLPRNIQQCLKDFDIPLQLSHTITDIQGDTRLQRVVVSAVDDQLRPIAGTEVTYPCDTLILSVGLIPENELSSGAGVVLDKQTKGAVVDEHFQTNVPGIFAAGNVLHVHDLVDFVSLEAEQLAQSAAAYVRGTTLAASPIAVQCGPGVGNLVPQRISGKTDITLAFRVRSPQRDGRIIVTQNGEPIVTKPFKRAVPAEMMHVQVKATALHKTGTLEVSMA